MFFTLLLIVLFLPINVAAQAKACPKKLKSILPKDNTGRVRFTDHITGTGERLFAKLEALNLEGMVMKRKASVYAFSRSRDWLKVKTSAGRLTMQNRIETWNG